MTQLNFITPPKQKPFVLLSLGFEGFEGECDHWDDCEDDVHIFHILVRIRHEMQRLKQRTGKDLRPFGTYIPFMKPREKLIANYNKAPIDFLFTLNVRDRRELDGRVLELPDTKHVHPQPCNKRWRTMVDVDTGVKTPIPNEICTFGGSKKLPYYGLLISSLEIFHPAQERYLQGKNLFYYLKEFPLKSWNRFSWGTLYVDPSRRSEAEPVEDRRVLATAKLVYPYVYEIRKK